MKYFRYIGTVLGLVILVFLLGPRKKFETITPALPEVELELSELEDYLNEKQSLVSDLRPDNGFQLHFFDSIQKTPYVLVYLHGFSASPMEAAPYHQEFARYYGMNFYAPLLAGHGRSSIESFKDLSPRDLVSSAAESLSIAKLLGEKIIVMSCSTGSSLATYLDAENEGLIHAHIMYSPNFDLEDRNSKLLTGPWGLQLGRWSLGGNYRSFQLAEEAMPFWTTRYRIEGVLALRNLIDQTMTDDVWAKIKSPLIAMYYYENEHNKDNIISTMAIEKFTASVGTAESKIKIRPMPEPKSHVIISPYQSQNVDVVLEATYEFAEDILNLQPVNLRESILSEPF